MSVPSNPPAPHGGNATRGRLTMVCTAVCLFACGANPASSREYPNPDSGSLSDAARASETGSQRPEAGPLAACPSTSDQPATGIWEDITPPEFKASPLLETYSVAVDALNPGVVYANAGDKTNGGTGSLGVFRSPDCGAHWSKVSAPGSEIETGGGFLLADFENPENLYITNLYGGNPTLYKSSNGGVDWQALATDVEHVLQENFVRSVAMDPTNSKHMVVSYHELCGAPLSALCLAESTDAGVTWRQFNGPPIAEKDLEGDGGGPVILDAKQMFFQHPSGLWYSNDDGQTWDHQFQAYQAPLNGGGPAGLYQAPSGALYLGVANTGIFGIAAPTAPIQATAWQHLSGAPQATSILDDGVNVYASWSWDTSAQPIATATVSNLTSWKPMTSATAMTRAVNYFSYDSGHAIAYAANMGGGLWRMHTR